MESSIPEKDPNFDQYFPHLIAKLPEAIKAINYLDTKDPKADLKDIYFEMYYKLEIKHFSQFYPEIKKTIPVWSWLHTQFGGTTCYHILRMLYCVINNKDYLGMSPYHRNILKWAVILHDIAKRCYPTIPEGERDAVHPYTSAIETLNVLDSLHEFKGMFSKEELNKLKNTIKASLIDDEKIDLSNLGDILAQAKKIFADSEFCYSVFKLVLLHQSIRGLPKIGRASCRERVYVLV